MADRIETHLIVKAISEGFEKVAKDQKKITEENEKQSKGLGGLKDSWLKVGVAVAAIGVAIQGLKKVWDFAEQGAQVRQQAESFDFLMDKIGVTTDILGGLREASRGTVDDMTLMSGTATLLAGAGDELAKKLAMATPQLMEIAKASNKLNPSLGTTAFMYESIATGIKRAQPLILDNLGLTIKVGAANEAYAKKIGIAVTALSAEQKAIAMLEAALESGGNLIAQVGGTTESATDSFARLGAVLKNVGNAAKAGLADALGPLAGRIADSVEETFTMIEAMNVLGYSMTRAGTIIDETGNQVDMTAGEIIALGEAVKGSTSRVKDLSYLFRDFPPLPVRVTGEPEAMRQLETFGEWLTRWSIENKRKVALQATFAAAQSIYIPETAADRIGGETQASGGPLAQVALVGEEGAEMIVNGVVIPAGITKKLMSLGLVPGKRFSLGGAIDIDLPYDGGGGITYDPEINDIEGGGGITYDPETYPGDVAPTTSTIADVAVTSSAITAPAAATEAAAAVADTVAAAASIQSQAIQAAIAKQTKETKIMTSELVAVREAIEELPEPIGARVIHGMETLDTR